MEHVHHFVPRPMVGGVLTCDCGATYRTGEVIPRHGITSHEYQPPAPSIVTPDHECGECGTRHDHVRDPGFTILYPGQGSPILIDSRVEEALQLVLEDRTMRVKVNDVGAYAVSFHRVVDGTATDENEAEWGTGTSVKEALRYALAVALGSSEMTDLAERLGGLTAGHRVEPEDMERLWGEV